MRVVRINATTLAAIDNPDIFSGSFAFHYAAVAVNARGHIAGTFSLGGPSLYPRLNAFIFDDFTPDPFANGWTSYIAATGTNAVNSWGDYNGAQRHNNYGNTWVGAGFTRMGATNEHRFLWFGRDRDNPNRLFPATDVGDTIATARNTGIDLNAGGSYSATNPIWNVAFGTRDVDLYSLQAVAGTTLTATTLLPAGGDTMDTILRVFNSAGTQVVANDDCNPPDRYSCVTYAVPATGTYYVGVSGYNNNAYNPNTGGSGVSGSVGDYQVNINVTGSGDVGDNLGTSLITGMGPLPSSYTMSRSTIGDGPYLTRDVDLYRFTANVGMRLTAATTLPAGAATMDTILRVFDSAGTQLTSNDDCNPPDRYSCVNNFRIPATGTYYVGVSGYNNSAYNPNVPNSGVPGSIGDYRLAMSLAFGPVANFLLTQSVATTVAGTPFSVTVRARDDGGNTITNYTGTVTFTSSDPVAGLPSNYTFVAGDNGVHTFTNGVTLYVAAPTQTVTVAQVGSPAINGTVNHTVNPDVAWYYYVYEGDTSLPPPTVTRNVAFPIYILPFDQYFNWITNYAGTIYFFSYDPLSVYPASYTFTGTEGGIGVPGNISFGTLGLQDLYVYLLDFSAVGLGQYNVIGPDGSPGPGRQGPGGSDVIGLLTPQTTPALPARVNLPTAPALDRGVIEHLLAGLDGQAGQEAFQQLVLRRLAAPAAHRMSLLIGAEIF